MSDFRSQCLHGGEAFPERNQFCDLLRQRKIGVLVGKIGIDFRIAVNQNCLLTKFDFGKLEINQCQEPPPAIFHHIIIIGIALQHFKCDCLEQRFQTFVNPAFDAGTQVHIIRFVAGSVRNTQNSVHLDFCTHTLDSFCY